jgi:PAS domain S-box-containing protein
MAEGAKGDSLTWALREFERRYAILVDASPVGIFHTDAEGQCLYVNRKWCEIAGLTEDQARGTGWVQALHPDDRARIFREWSEAASRQRPFVSEYRFQRPDGTIAWVLGQGVAERGSAEEVLGYVGTITDITTHRRVDEALNTAQEGFEAQLAQRTAELVRRVRELERDKAQLTSVNTLMMEREQRILELKDEVNQLLKAAGKAAKYVG